MSMLLSPHSISYFKIKLVSLDFPQHRTAKLIVSLLVNSPSTGAHRLDAISFGSVYRHNDGTAAMMEKNAGRVRTTKLRQIKGL